MTSDPNVTTVIGLRRHSSNFPYRATIIDAVTGAELSDIFVTVTGARFWLWRKRRTIRRIRHQVAKGTQIHVEDF